MDSSDFFQNDNDYYNYLFAITGNEYVFAESSVRKWNNRMQDGLFFQLMPLNSDDGFFDWYTDKTPNQQFFVNKAEAILRFVKNWIEWKKII